MWIRKRINYNINVYKNIFYENIIYNFIILNKREIFFSSTKIYILIIWWIVNFTNWSKIKISKIMDQSKILIFIVLRSTTNSDILISSW